MLIFKFSILLQINCQIFKTGQKKNLLQWYDDNLNILKDICELNIEMEKRIKKAIIKYNLEDILKHLVALSARKFENSTSFFNSFLLSIIKMKKRFNQFDLYFNEEKEFIDKKILYLMQKYRLNQVFRYEDLLDCYKSINISYVKIWTVVFFIKLNDEISGLDNNETIRLISSDKFEKIKLEINDCLDLYKNLKNSGPFNTNIIKSFIEIMQISKIYEDEIFMDGSGIFVSSFNSGYDVFWKNFYINDEFVHNTKLKMMLEIIKRTEIAIKNVTSYLIDNYICIDDKIKVKMIEKHDKWIFGAFNKKVNQEKEKYDNFLNGDWIKMDQKSLAIDEFFKFIDNSIEETYFKKIFSVLKKKTIYEIKNLIKMIYKEYLTLKITLSKNINNSIQFYNHNPSREKLEMRNHKEIYKFFDKISALAFKKLLLIVHNYDKCAKRGVLECWNKPTNYLKQINDNMGFFLTTFESLFGTLFNALKINCRHLEYIYNKTDHDISFLEVEVEKIENAVHIIYYMKSVFIKEISYFLDQKNFNEKIKNYNNFNYFLSEISKSFRSYIFFSKEFLNELKDNGAHKITFNKIYKIVQKTTKIKEDLLVFFDKLDKIKKKIN